MGAQLVGAVPSGQGLNAAQMLGGATTPLKALLLFGVDPLLDTANPAAAAAAVGAAEFVVMLGPFQPNSALHADVLLPIAPFSETSGTFVNAGGRAQGFHGVVKPAGETRPGWKVLRVLGNLLELSGFDFETSEEVRQQALGDTNALGERLNNRSAVDLAAAARGLNPAAAPDLERLSDVPIYATDALVRNAPALQMTADARAAEAVLPSALWSDLGLDAGAKVRVAQGAAQAVLPARLDASLAAGTVRIAAGLAETATLGAMFGPLTVARV